MKTDNTQAQPVVAATVEAARPTDDELLELNAGEVFFSESPSRYPECGHGTQYHAGAPGVLQFARAAIELATPPRHAALDVALQVLEQIATTPRNRKARVNAKAALLFLQTQLAAQAANSPKDEHPDCATPTPKGESK